MDVPRITTQVKIKPLGRKSYGSIPHLPGSRRGPADRGLEGAQAAIAIEKVPSKHHYIIVQEKLDGSNVGVAKINGVIVPLSRSGYHARTSPYEQHHMFADWVDKWANDFKSVLNEGERICGEWLAQAHGTKYNILSGHLCFVAFDIINGSERLPFSEFIDRANHTFMTPHVLHNDNSAFSIEAAVDTLGDYGFHGALEKPEGAVWRVEFDRMHKGGIRKREVLFLCKYVNPEKVDGRYFPKISGEDEVWNWRPE